jgi:type IV pilus assembly protein PilN
MEITINFAAEPYQQVQRFVRRWRLALAALALAAVTLAVISATSFAAWRTTRRQAAELERQIAREEQRRAAAEAFLNRPENRRTRQAAEFLNATFARKAFSWTEVFTDLEPIMPAKVHVTGIRPEFNDDGRLELHLTVSAAARDAGVELVRRLESSSHFAQAQITDEKKQDERAGNTFQYNITAIYIPGFAREKKAAANTAPAATPTPASGNATEPANRQVEQALVRH